MTSYTEEELVSYIWKHYQSLIDQECDYLAMVRVYSGFKYSDDIKNKHDLSKDEKYRAMPKDWLKNELLSFTGEKRKRIAMEVLSKHSDRIHLNICPNCGKLPASPEAEYCLHCRASWRWTNPLRRIMHQAKNDEL